MPSQEVGESTPILKCIICNDEVMRSEFENGSWIHCNDEFFLRKQEWTYDHEPMPGFIEGRVI